MFTLIHEHMHMHDEQQFMIICMLRLIDIMAHELD